MALGGLVGQAEYEGQMAPFLPFLLFGQWTHVGKNATFGLGRCEVRGLIRTTKDNRVMGVQEGQSIVLAKGVV